MSKHSHTDKNNPEDSHQTQPAAEEPSPNNQDQQSASTAPQQQNPEIKENLQKMLNDHEVQTYLNTPNAASEGAKKLQGMGGHHTP